MKRPPTAHQFGNRLDHLDRQIRDCLSNIRQHLHELEGMVHTRQPPEALPPNIPPHKKTDSPT